MLNEGVSVRQKEISFPFECFFFILRNGSPHTELNYAPEKTPSEPRVTVNTGCTLGHTLTRRPLRAASSTEHPRADRGFP